MAESCGPRPMFSSVRTRFCFLAVILLTAGPRLLPAAPDAPPADNHGPLGATPQEIVRRFGPVLKHNARVRNHQVLEGGTVLDGDLHGKNGLIVRVVYHQDHVVLLEYTRAVGMLTVADVNTLLASCADNSTWEMGKDSTDAAKFYHRADGRAIAHWAVADDSFLIASEGDNPNGTLIDRLLP